MLILFFGKLVINFTLKYLNTLNFLSCLFAILLISCCKSILDTGTNEKEIRNVWDNTINAICTGDLSLFEKCWAHTEIIQVVHPSHGEVLQGWLEIENHYQKVLNSDFRCFLQRNELSVMISRTGDIAWGMADMIVQFNDSIGSTSHL